MTEHHLKHRWMRDSHQGALSPHAADTAAPGTINVCDTQARANFTQDRKRQVNEMEGTTLAIENELEEKSDTVKRPKKTLAKEPELTELNKRAEKLRSKIHAATNAVQTVTSLEKQLKKLQEDLAKKPSEETLRRAVSRAESELATTDKLEKTILKQKRQLKPFHNLIEKKLKQNLQIEQGSKRLSQLQADDQVLKELNEDVQEMTQRMEAEPSLEELKKSLKRAEEAHAEILALKAAEEALYAERNAELVRVQQLKNDTRLVQGILDKGPTLGELQAKYEEARSQQACKDDFKVKLDALQSMERMSELIMVNDVLSSKIKTLEEDLEMAMNGGQSGGSDYLKCLEVVAQNRLFPKAVAEQAPKATAPEHYIPPEYVDKLMSDEAVLDAIMQYQGWKLHYVNTNIDELILLVFRQDLWNIVDCMLQDEPLAIKADVTVDIVRRAMRSMTREAHKEKHLMEAIASCRSNLSYLIRYAYACNVEVDKEATDKLVPFLADKVDVASYFMARPPFEQPVAGSDDPVTVETKKIIDHMGDHEFDSGNPWKSRQFVNKIQFGLRVSMLCELHEWDTTPEKLVNAIYAYAGKKCLVHLLMCECLSRLDEFVEEYYAQYEQTVKNEVVAFISNVIGANETSAGELVYLHMKEIMKIGSLCVLHKAFQTDCETDFTARVHYSASKVAQDALGQSCGV